MPLRSSKTFKDSRKHEKTNEQRAKTIGKVVVSRYLRFYPRSRLVIAETEELSEPFGLR